MKEKQTERCEKKRQPTIFQLEKMCFTCYFMQGVVETWCLAVLEEIDAAFIRLRYKTLAWF